MIIIEVRFGAINGNAITIDSALSGTSTNPVQNKVIKAALDALQNQINAIAATKEVVSVENAEALYDIENPSTEVVYITEDTGDLYIYNGSTFVLSTNEVVDGTIYVDDIDALIDMTLASGKTYPVVCVTEASGDDPATMESYTLNVASDGRTLIAKDGFAVIDNGAWSWSKYSFEGHTHTTSDVTGLSDAITNATVNKQDKSDNNLNTTDKTVVGAINELRSALLAFSRSFTIDFQTGLSVVHDVVANAITIKKIYTFNISSLKYQKGSDAAVTLTPDANGVIDNLTIAIAAGTKVDWEVLRTTEDQPSTAGIIYEQ